MRISDWSSDVCSSDLAYPDITLDLVVEDRLVDVVQAGFDAGVRLGEKLEKDMVAVKLGRELEMVAVAAPAYLERFGIPGSPRELPQHRCMNYTWPTDFSLYSWEFEHGLPTPPAAVDGPLRVNAT